MINTTSASVFLLFLFASVCIYDTTRASEVKQVIVIHRHGARYPLKKHPHDPSDENIEDRTDILYLQGELQLAALGQYIKATYFPSISDSPYRVVSYSSDLRRTLVSSRSFLSGLLGEKQGKVATLMFEPSNVDWIIRGYALCPRIKTKFLEFTKSKEFKEWKSKYEKDISEIADVIDVEDKSFENIFNIYDRFKTMAYSNEPDKLSTDQRDTLVRVANWYESNKFHRKVHEANIAGGLLKKIADWMHNFNEDISNSSQEKHAKVIEVSAHYPTLLTLLSSLNTASDKIESPADKIPQFGAAIIAELRDDGKVRFQWYPGDTTDSGNVQVSTVQIKRDGCDGDQCNLKEAFGSARNFEMDTFCTQCASKSEVCLKLDCTSSSTSRHIVYVILIFLLGAVLAGLSSFFYARSVYKDKMGSTRYFSGENDSRHEHFDDPLTIT